MASGSGASSIAANNGPEPGQDRDKSEDREGDGEPWWSPHNLARAAPWVLGAAAALGIAAVALSTSVQKHVASNSKKDKATGETLVTDPDMRVPVRRGDTLHSIAAKCKVSVSELQAANKLKGDKILAGSKLYIPAVLKPSQTQQKLQPQQGQVEMEGEDDD